MENGANTTPYPMNIINLAPLGSAQKKQKEHKENKHESKQKNKTNIEEKKEESIKVTEEIDSDNDIPSFKAFVLSDKSSATPFSPILAILCKLAIGPIGVKSNLKSPVDTIVPLGVWITIP